MTTTPVKDKRGISSFFSENFSISRKKKNKSSANESPDESILRLRSTSTSSSHGRISSSLHQSDKRYAGISQQLVDGEEDIQQANSKLSNHISSQPPNKDHKARDDAVQLVFDHIFSLHLEKIPVLPSSAEKQTYTFVIKLILQGVYDGLWSLEGLELFGHRLSLIMDRGNIEKAEEFPEFDRDALIALVETLLKQKQFNMKWLPDSLEKALFVNILLVIFGTIQVLAQNLKLDIIGHHLRFEFGKNGRGYDRLEKSIISFVSEKEIDQKVKETLDNPEYNNKYIPDAIEKELYKNIYVLILCVVQDICQDLKIHILGDTIKVMIAPAVEKKPNHMIASSSPSHPPHKQQSHSLENEIKAIVQALNKKDDSVFWLSIGLSFCCGIIFKMLFL